MSIFVHPIGSSEFEVDSILSHKVTIEGIIKYKIKWKPTFVKNMAEIIEFKNDIRSVSYNEKAKLFRIQWNNTYLSSKEVRRNADEELALYLLLKFKNGQRN